MSSTELENTQPEVSEASVAVESSVPQVENAESSTESTAVETTESKEEIEESATETSDVTNGNAKPEVTLPPPSIHDEEAFPALGSGSSTTKSAPISWGPSMTPSPASTNGSSKSTVTRSKNLQEAFNISNVVSLDLSKAEFAKIINDLKKTYSVSIESTLSSITKNRSFIVTGLPKDVIKARKELVRRLTKPTSVKFLVPVRTISAIIGSAGKNLKPIIEATSTKINIGKHSTPTSDDDDETVEVSIEGDVDGCEEAKKSILKIVAVETKNLTTRISVSEDLAPFVEPLDEDGADLTVVGPTKNNVITITGLKDLVVHKKADITASLEKLQKEIKTEEKTIPKKLHKFLNVSGIYEEFNVVVKVPNADSADQVVSFVGLPANVAKAITHARVATSKFTSESLDISKAHGNNINHARALASYFEYSGILGNIGSEFNTNITIPSYSKLASKDLKTITLEISGASNDLESIKASRKAIIQEVNNLPPSRVRFITDINRLFSKRVIGATEQSAKINNTAVVPLSHLSNDETDEIILIALEGDDEDFAPSQEEIDARLDKVNESLDEIRHLQADLRTVVLDIPSEKQQFIEGPNGTTLKAILEAFEHSALAVKLHNDGQNEAANKVFIQGPKHEVTKVEKDIAALLKDAEDVKDIYSFKATTTVATSVLPRLIGKNGASLNNLRDKFSVEVDVEKNPVGEKASLTITGYKFNVKEAETFIAHAAKKWADEITKSLIVPKKYRSSLIGLNGQHVKKLQTKYNVSINFSSVSDSVEIRGPSRGVLKAEEELSDLLDFEIENGYTKEIEIPQSAVSRVIGRQGDTINRIAIDAGIDIKINSDDKTSEKRKITLTGSRKGLTAAEKAINEIVTDLEDTITVELDVQQKYFRDILGSRGSRKQEIIENAGGLEEKDYRRLLQIPEQGSGINVITSSGPKKIVESIVEQIKKIVADKENTISDSLDIPQSKFKLLIGPAGSTRRALEEEFNVLINIPRLNEKSGKVKVSGLKENIEKAKAKIEELTADNWTVSIDVPAYIHSAVSERGSLPRRLKNELNVDITHGDASTKAFRLSSSYPSVPKEAFGNPEEEKVKFTFDTSESKKDDTDIIEWRLSGGDDSVKEAEHIIRDSIAKFSDAETTAFIWVKDSSNFGKIVGPQGSRLNGIRSKSGSQIYIPRPTDKINNIIYLRGTKTEMEKAEKLLSSELEKLLA